MSELLYVTVYAVQSDSLALDEDDSATVVQIHHENETSDYAACYAVNWQFEQDPRCTTLLFVVSTHREYQNVFTAVRSVCGNTYILQYCPRYITKFQVMAKHTFDKSDADQAEDSDIRRYRFSSYPEDLKVDSAAFYAHFFYRMSTGFFKPDFEGQPIKGYHDLIMKRNIHPLTITSALSETINTQEIAPGE